MRPSGRAPDQMRAIVMQPGYTSHAEGSCLVAFGETRVLCTASVENNLPGWLRGSSVAGHRRICVCPRPPIPRAAQARGKA